MDFHAGRWAARTVTTQYDWPAKAYPSFTRDGRSRACSSSTAAPAKPGAPFADPCPDTFKIGSSTRSVATRNYRAAYIQFDMTVNRAGWHDRQARIITLEQDAVAYAQRRHDRPSRSSSAPTPATASRFAATNLIPHVLNLDDFQIFTPTDTIGQHIHLVKFDVTSSDGAGNGWNYEDGTFSPGEVQERIEANNAFQNATGGTQILHPVTNPLFGAGPDHDGNGVGDYVGAQTTIQRWWADPLLNNGGPGPHHPHRLHARSLRPQLAPAPRLLRRAGRRADRLSVEGARRQRARRTSLMAARHRSRPTSSRPTTTKSYREFNSRSPTSPSSTRADLTPGQSSGTQGGRPCR